MAECIERDKFLEAVGERNQNSCDGKLTYQQLKEMVENFPTADVVPIEALKKWLWKVALNNSDNYLGDACEELVNRLGGLRRYVKDGEE